MKVAIAKNSGFCFGVKKAIEIAKKSEGNVYTLGPLIHNPQVIEGLEKRGIKSINSINKIKKGTVIIRTHGVPDKVIKKIKDKKLNIIDSTCPFVRKVQDYAKFLYKNGYKVVVAGESNHPEVIGIVGNIRDAIVVEKPEDIKKLRIYDKIGVVAQTTQSVENFEKIIKNLKTKCKELKVYNTICNATTLRQKSAKELAKKVDLMVIVGGKNSGNTRRLKDICTKITETKLIESASDLNKEWFRNKKQVGVSAGASTPDWVVKEVVNKIREF